MKKGDMKGLKSICEEGMYWGKQPKSRLRKLRRSDYRIPESSNEEEDESDEDDEEEVELSHSSVPTATSSLSCSQQQPPFVKEFSGLSSTCAFAPMLKNRRSSLSGDKESRMPEDFREEIKDIMAEMIQKESENFETDVEVVITKLGQHMIKVIKNVRNEHQGIASRAVRDSPASKVYEAFRQRFRRIFVTALEKEWAFRRKLCPTAFPVLSQLIVKVLRDIREVIQEGIPEWIAGQNELVAGRRSRGPEAQESRATEDNIRFKKEWRKKEKRKKGKEGRL